MNKRGVVRVNDGQLVGRKSDDVDRLQFVRRVLDAKLGAFACENKLSRLHLRVDKDGGNSSFESIALVGCGSMRGESTKSNRS